MESSSLTAVGVWFYAYDTQRYLYLMRNDAKYPGTWGLPGGKCEPGETLLESIERECQEELGRFPEYIKLLPLVHAVWTSGDFYTGVALDKPASPGKEGYIRA